MTDRPYPDTPITQGNNIIDISGTGLKQFWDLKAHLQDSSTLATAKLSRDLGPDIRELLAGPRCNHEADLQIIGAPSFFPRVWSWVKDGSTPSSCPRCSSCRNRRCTRLYLSTSTRRAYRRSTAGSSTGHGATCQTSNRGWSRTCRAFGPQAANWTVSVGEKRGRQNAVTRCWIRRRRASPKPLGTLDRDYEAVFYARQGDHAEPNGNAAPAAAAAHPREPPRPSTDSTPTFPPNRALLPLHSRPAYSVLAYDMHMLLPCHSVQ